MIKVDLFIYIAVLGRVAARTPTRGESAAIPLWTPAPPRTTGSSLQLRGLTDLGLILLRRLYNGLNQSDIIGTVLSTGLLTLMERSDSTFALLLRFQGRL
jgi:hypothetical protein